MTLERSILAAARAEIDAVVAMAAQCGTLQQAMLHRWNPGETDGPPPVSQLLALWSFAIVAEHWPEATGDMADMMTAIASRPWSEQTIRMDGVKLSRMLMGARRPFGGIRAAARIAAGGIWRVDGGVALSAHAEIAPEGGSA